MYKFLALAVVAVGAAVAATVYKLKARDASKVKSIEAKEAELRG